MFIQGGNLKYDKAYSELFEEFLTIYEVRELNFDEESYYDSDSDRFFCPDELCRSEQKQKSVLTTVNAKKIVYKKTPHFKDIPSTQHRKACPYLSDGSNHVNIETNSSHAEGVKETDFPTEFILERKKYTKKKKTGEIKETQSKSNEIIKTNSENKIEKNTNKKSPNRTSVFEHIVECYFSNSNDKELLKTMPLTIGGLKINYNFFFKQILYFQDREGLIYWGKVKKITDYKYSFSITFEKKVSGKSISAYINKNTVESYRKKNYFLDFIRNVIEQKEEVNCFFLGAYPVLKTITTQKKDNTGKIEKIEFEVFNIEIINLDHFLLRSIK